MGNYLNPGNGGFARIKSDAYVDKSGLIALINETVETPRCLSCVSRPRRFGKSFDAQMLCAYYDRGCDSSALFADLAIANEPEHADSYRRHLNQYNVIYLDMTAVIGEVSHAELVSFIKQNIVLELENIYPGVVVEGAFMPTLANAAAASESKFVMIIDEWDAPIREAKYDLEVQRKYLEFLRSLFKNSGMTAKVFAAAYMTGILPVKKDGSQSAISDFQEYSVIHPMQFAQYVGFTQGEVQELCRSSGIDFSMMKLWYDGYGMGEIGSVYNPNSVMRAIRNRRFRSYWTETSASKSLMEYISLDFDGMSKTVAELLGGIEVPVDVDGFANDLVSFSNRDDVLALLIHLGYLTYREEAGTARIPNEEIRIEFARAVRSTLRDETVRRVRESCQLILDTIVSSESVVVVLMHNHPSTQAFSLEDVQFFVQHPMLAVIAVVSNQGTVHYLKRDKDFDYKKVVTLFKECIQGLKRNSPSSDVYMATLTFLAKCSKLL